MPSLAPNTAARNQPMRSVRCNSLWRPLTFPERRYVVRGRAPGEQCTDQHSGDGAGGDDLPGIGVDVLIRRPAGRAGLRQRNVLQLDQPGPGRMQRLLRPRACPRDVLPGLTGRVAQQLFHVGGEHPEVGHQLVGGDPPAFFARCHFSRVHVRRPLRVGVAGLLPAPCPSTSLRTIRLSPKRLLPERLPADRHAADQPWIMTSVAR